MIIMTSLKLQNISSGWNFDVACDWQI